MLAWIFIGTIWGIADGFTTPFTVALLASEFTEKSIPFCVYLAVKNLFVFAGFLFAGYYWENATMIITFSNRILRSAPAYILLLVVLVSGIIGYCSSLMFPYLEENVTSNTINQNKDVELKSHRHN